MKKFFISVFLTLIFCSTAFASGWIQEGMKWKYEKNGRILKNEWQFIDNKYYHFDENGYMQTGLVDIDGSVYYFLNDGVGTRGEVKIGKNTYKVGERGKVLKLPEDFNLQEYYYSIEDQEKEKIEKSKQASEKALESSILQSELDKILEEKAKENAEIAANENAFLNSISEKKLNQNANNVNNPAALADAKKAEEQKKKIENDEILRRALKFTLSNKKTITHMYNCEDDKGKKKTVGLTIEIPVLQGQNQELVNKILEEKIPKVLIDEAAGYIDEKSVYKPIEFKCDKLLYVNDKLIEFQYKNKGINNLKIYFDLTNGNTRVE